MSRQLIIDLIIMLIVIFTLMIVQFAGAQTLGPLRDVITDDPLSQPNAEENIDEMYTTVTFWVPLVGQIGSIVIVVWREFRRQRVTGRRGVI